MESIHQFDLCRYEIEDALKQEGVLESAFTVCDPTLSDSDGMKVGDRIGVSSQLHAARYTKVW